MNISDRIIIITQNKEYEAAAESIAAGNKFTVEKNEQLHSFEAIAREIEKSKSTSCVRSSFHAFIREHGIPFLILTDYPVKAESRNDEIAQKLFITLLMSYMIIAQGKGCSHIKGNIFVNITDGDIKSFKQKIIHPEKLIAAIAVKDQRAHAILHQYASQKAFHSLFFIKPFSSFDNEPLPTALKSYVESINKRNMIIAKLMQKQKHAVVKSQDPAKVLVRISREQYAMDQELFPIGDSSYKKYAVGEIHVIGEWTNYHSRTVAGKIISVIKKGFPGWKLGYDDAVAIHLEDAVVDHTTPAVLAQIIHNDLKAYGNVVIYCSHHNYKILEAADGFSLVRKSILFKQP